jgi:hypothetical protein
VQLLLECLSPQIEQASGESDCHASENDAFEEARKRARKDAEQQCKNHNTACCLDVSSVSYDSDECNQGYTQCDSLDDYICLSYIDGFDCEPCPVEDEIVGI